MTKTIRLISPADGEVYAERTPLTGAEARDKGEPKEEAKHEGPDMQALVSALVEAVRNIQPPQVTVTPAMPTTTGAAWEVEGKGPGGHPFKMKITKL